MGSKWRKAKLALGLNLCVYVPRTLDDSAAPSSERLSDAALLSPTNWDSRPMTPTPSSHGLRLAKSGSKPSKLMLLPELVFQVNIGDGPLITCFAFDSSENRKKDVDLDLALHFPSFHRCGFGSSIVSPVSVESFGSSVSTV
ncbi:hypothetical protein POTOM_061604 [Populus tomentosa]|uniref:Uncharacterized protein n=1 Tax=Populus tomentosa TaxID=118781 RepID=A0A8X7XRM4_POPTO|nr:hypothetical protein POTOM_061604 [Populus tomentosa]